MKRLALTAALLLVTSATSAQTAAPAPAGGPVARQDTASQSTVTTSVETRANQNKVDAKDEVADRNCLRYTGSRLIRADSKGRKCATATGRSYTSEDIERTGAIDLTDALRRLDPAVH